jgi:hypothetical protein
MSKNIGIVSMLILTFSPAFAFASFVPGQTLDPQCLPSDSSCIVIGVASNVAGSFTATSTATSTFVGPITTSGTTGGYFIDGNLILQASSTNFSTLIGIGAGSALNSSGTFNTAVGQNTLTVSTSSILNTAIGMNALNANTSGNNNTALGVASLYANTTGANNTASGVSALQQNTTGINNVGFGYGSLFSNTSGTGNTALGVSALGIQTTGFGNIGVGYNAGSNLTTGSNNIIIGFSISATSSTATNSLNIGNMIFGTGINGQGTTVSTGNVGIGTSTPWGRLSVGTVANSSAPQFVVASSTATSFIIDKSGNVGIGTTTPAYTLDVNGTVNASGGTQSGPRNVGFSIAGGQALFSNNGNSSNLFVGNVVGTNATGSAAYFNTIFGLSSGANIADVSSGGGYANSFFGYNAGNALTVGVGNVFLGNNAGQLSTTGVSNTIVGTNAGFLLTTGGGNTLLGSAAGGTSGGLTTGNNNIFVGAGSRGITTGSNNIMIGNLLNAASTTDSNQMNIQNILYGRNNAGNAATVSTGQIGIGTSTPWGRLSIAAVDNASIPQFVVASSTATSFIIDKSGNVGIGTASPSAVLDVQSSGSSLLGLTSSTTFAGIQMFSYRNSVLTHSLIEGLGARGTKTAPLAVQAGDALFSIRGAGYGTSDFDSNLKDDAAAIELKAESAFTDSGGNPVHPGMIVFETATGSGFDLERMRLTSTGNLGIGTTSPWAQLSVSAPANASNPQFVVASSSAVSLIVDASGKVGVGTASPTSNFEVAGKSIAFNTNQDGSLGAWNTNANALPGTLRQEAVVSANGYIYTTGGTLSGSPTANVYFAKLNGDGSIGIWTLNQNSLPAVRVFHTSVIANGYIYVIGGRTAGGGTSVFTTYYAKLNSDGSTGTWGTTAVLLAAGTKSASVTANGYIYVLAGDHNGALDNLVYYAKTNADGTLNAWTLGTLLPDQLDAPSASIANGYVYVMGGTSNNLGTVSSSTYYAKLNANGTVGAWSTTASLPLASDQAMGAFTANGYIYRLGGFDGTNAMSAVYYAKVNSNGTLGAWVTNTTALPAVRDLGAGIMVNGYAYVLGGNDGTSDQSTVYYASTARFKFSGSLDLLGLTSGASAIGDASGDVGGSIFAGNIFSANKLEVSGNTQLWNGLSVSGPVSILGATSTVSSPLFNIGTTSNTSIFSVLSNGNVGIGTSSPTAQFSTTGTVRFSNFGAGTLTTDASGNLSVSSDERLKNIDGQFTRSLSDILKINPISYHWNQLSGLDTSNSYTGFSAQNMQAAIPEAVGSSTNGFLSLQDRPILATIVNAVKDVGSIAGVFRDNMVAWLGNPGNGLAKIRADQVCAKTSSGTDVCMTGDQMQAMLNQINQTTLQNGIGATPQNVVLPPSDGTTSSKSVNQSETQSTSSTE